MRVLIGVVFLLSAACAHEGIVKTDVSSNIALVDDHFKVIARLGASPRPIQKKGAVAHYAFFPQGRAPEYLLIVEPAALDGELSLDVQKNGTTVSNVAPYHEYIDLLLRTQRQIFRGELAEAKSSILRIENRFDTTFGSLILQAFIELLENDLQLAGEHLRAARMLRPEAKIFQVLK